MKKKKTGRRAFLAGAIGAQLLSRQASADVKRPRDEAREKLERLAARYGSELGDLRKAGR